MVRDRISNRFTSRSWPVNEDYSDEEDYLVDFCSQHEQDLEQLANIDNQLQASVRERMETGERFRDAYDAVSRQHASNVVSRLEDELGPLGETLSELTTAFVLTKNNWAMEDSANHELFDSFGQCAWATTDAPGRISCILSWLSNIPPDIFTSIGDLPIQQDLIVRKKLEIDDMWRWYEGEQLLANRDPFCDNRWSCIWGDSDVRFGDDIENRPNGFHDLRIPGGPANQSMRDKLGSAWSIRLARLDKASNDLISKQFSVCDFVIPNQISYFERSLLAFIDTLGDDTYDLAEDDAAGWSNLRDEIEEAHATRTTWCNYDGAGNLYLDDTVYRVEKSADNNDNLTILYEKHADVMVWLENNTQNIPTIFRLLDLPQLQDCGRILKTLYYNIKLSSYTKLIEDDVSRLRFQSLTLSVH